MKKTMKHDEKSEQKKHIEDLHHKLFINGMSGEVFQVGIFTVFFASKKQPLEPNKPTTLFGWMEHLAQHW